MSSQLGSVEVTCDAPPYEVVGACARLGFRTPLDVRWARSSRLVSGRPQVLGVLRFAWWMELLGLSEPAGSSCSCGERLPDLQRHRFVYPTGEEIDYLLGQCPRCRTIYWDEG